MKMHEKAAEIIISYDLQLFKQNDSTFIQHRLYDLFLFCCFLLWFDYEALSAFCALPVES
jgi:hypothetical protein